jgi:hypothetical protein
MELMNVRKIARVRTITIATVSAFNLPVLCLAPTPAADS